MTTQNLDEAALLEAMNSDLPARDWKGGARRYVQDFFDRYSREQIESFIHTKPLAQITPEDPVGSLTEDVSYLFNFASMLKLLALPRGARILDVACGGGWVSHWLMKLGYETRGFDISAEFVSLARARVLRDPDLHRAAFEIEAAFFVHDIEEAPLPSAMRSNYDAVVLESCLHHFANPVAVLRNLAECLSTRGVILIIEGENRQGPIRPEYLKVMLETSTLERPYPRAQLVSALELAGLHHHTFLGVVEGYAPEGSETEVSAIFRATAIGRNICICATSREALDRVVQLPHAPPQTAGGTVEPATFASGSEDPQPTQAPVTPASTALVDLATAIKLSSPTWARPALKMAWRVLRKGAEQT